MTKIKNFRITLRPREMARWLKRERGAETTPELELAIEQLIKESKIWISPAAVYTTLTRQIAEKTTALSFPDKSIAVSVVAISIGTALHEQCLSAQSDPVKEPLVAAIEQEALAQAVQFAVRLIQDQAKEEDCEAPAPVTAEDLQTATALATLVGIQRIGINLDAAASELPPHARVAWLFWTPAGKGTGRTPAYRQAGPEKVAV